jgi:hypothetical protein
LNALIFDRAWKIAYLDLPFLCKYLQWTIDYEKYFVNTKTYEAKMTTTLKLAEQMPRRFLNWLMSTNGKQYYGIGVHYGKFLVNKKKY